MRDGPEISSAGKGRSTATRQFVGRFFHAVCAAAMLVCLAAIAGLLATIVGRGASWLDWNTLSGPVLGTLVMVALATVMAIPIGVGAAIYLEEYAEPSRVNRLIRANISNLAGLPSIVFGVLALAVVLQFFQSPAGLFVGALTLALTVLPVTILAVQQSLRDVPAGLREASAALGASRWQTVRNQVLPKAVPGIVSGSMRAVARALGEAAPLLVLGIGLASSEGTDEPSLDVLPVQIFFWSQDEATHGSAAAAITVLLVMLLAMHAIAFAVGRRFEKV